MLWPFPSRSRRHHGTPGARTSARVSVSRQRLLAFAAEARYFYSPEKTLSWVAATRILRRIFTSDFPAEPFGVEDLAYLAENGKAFT